MRGIFVLGAVIGLTACGGPDTSQANNAQANISHDARPPSSAEPARIGSSSPAQAPVFAGPVSGANAVRTMHDRHEDMETMGKTAKAIKGQLDSGTPDLAAVHASATKIADLLRRANGWFPAGTGPQIGKTGAKPEIWQGSTIKADFVAKLAASQKAAQAFDGAASGTDVAAIQQRFADLGGTCKACHDKYRTDMHH
jgi:cytochrome c556